MASTTTNGVVLRTPYAIINNFRSARNFTLSTKGPDYRPGFNSLEARDLVRKGKPDSQRFVYVGDVVSYDLIAPANDAQAAAFDVIAVNQTTGVATKQAEVGFNAVWQKSVSITITAIDATTGAVTFTTAWS